MALPYDGTGGVAQWSRDPNLLDGIASQVEHFVFVFKIVTSRNDGAGEAVCP
jgi:hypothetical protein